MQQHRPAPGPGPVGGRAAAHRFCAPPARCATSAAFITGAFTTTTPSKCFSRRWQSTRCSILLPGELPPFIAYRLNGQPIPLERGGPVRMLIPWAHGFKSVKWLQHITLTNDYQANDTYALQNNDPESYLKTAAYIDDPEPRQLPRRSAGSDPGYGHGRLARPRTGGILAQARGWHPRPHRRRRSRLENAQWRPARSIPPPDWGGGLPEDVKPSQVWGFGPDGKPKEWPMRFSIALWSVSLNDLKPGGYEFRVRTVDKNGFAQPEPRPFHQRSGLNAIQCKQFIVTA